MTNSNQRQNHGSTIAFEQFAVMAATLTVHLRKQVHCTHQSTLYISRVKPLYTHSNNGWKYNVFLRSQKPVYPLERPRDGASLSLFLCFTGSSDEMR